MQSQLTRTDGVRTAAAVGFIALGLMFLLGVARFWPLFVIVPGLACLVPYYRGGRQGAYWAVPGALLVGTGLLLMFQSLTDYWESWAYAWTLLGVFIGVGLRMMGERLENASLRQVGRWMAIVSGAAFLTIGGLVLVLTSALLRLLLMLAFFAAGVFLLWQVFGKRRTAPVASAPAKTPTHARGQRSVSSVEENIRRIRQDIAELPSDRRIV
ncbi:MAG: hypothetical protein HC915_20365 [Anaerolineae bacterium]|nr:hypothetical protein [Anaerolineae bacterium]